MSTKSFKEYYQDPEFRENHKKYIMTKVRCPCGTWTARANMSHHRHTLKHNKWLEEHYEEDSQVVQLQKEVAKLKRKIKKLRNI
jgi:hypothetical protein